MMIIPTRRGFIGGLIGLVAAPALVRAEIIMPVKTWRFIPFPLGPEISLWRGMPGSGGVEVSGLGYRRAPVGVRPFTRVHSVVFGPFEESEHVTHAVLCGVILPIRSLDAFPGDSIHLTIDPKHPQDWSV